jgi:REP element-mobilizing transposase RayT
MWNLPPPPGFQGLHPDKPLTAYFRHLPHWRQDGATYFVTFRLADSLPQSKLDEMDWLRKDWELRHPRPHTKAVWDELTREVNKCVECWLDQGMGSCVLRQPSLASWVTSALDRFNDDWYELDCYTVMPNHVHVIVRPLAPEIHPLESILGSWKKYSSRRINLALNRVGELWQDEAFDRIIRNEEHLWRAIQYIGRNPGRAGLTPNGCPLWVRPQWVELGWQFEARS